MPAPIPRLEDYGLHPDAGFLPPSSPLTNLSNPYYAPWETTISALPDLISTNEIRAAVAAMPILSTSKLTSEPEYQRAYTLLAFLAHGYIWAPGAPPASRLPPAISVPLLEICATLGTLPTITYAALCLWNMRPLHD
jgi:indoleamine 2,3-dioxygenase